MPAVNLRRDAYDVYIGRPGPWGNPFRIGPHGNRAKVIAKYARWLLSQVREGKITVQQLAKLHGVRTGCFCKPQPCHGDILELAAEAAHLHLERNRPHADAKLFTQELESALKQPPKDRLF